MYLKLFLLLFFIPSTYSTKDILFLIDSSPSVLINEDCDHMNLVRNFTSEIVNNLTDFDIRYKSIQYNLNAKDDYKFSYNNSYVYQQMKNYKFNVNYPTLIHTGLNKISNSYNQSIDYHKKHNIIIFIFTDGDTLNLNDAYKSVDNYPFSDQNTEIIINRVFEIIFI